MYRNLFIKEFVNFALSDKEEGRSVPEEKRPGRSSDPDNYKELELDYKVETPFGELKVYFVQDDRDGQMAVREIMNTQKGKHWKGLWEPLYGDGQGGLDQRAFEWWEKQFNLTPKRAAFLNGNIVAFCASESGDIEWCDMDGHLWVSKVPLVVKKESVVRKVGDFLKICRGTIWSEHVVLKDSGIDDINSMEVRYIEEKMYLYDEKGGDIVSEYIGYIPHKDDDYEYIFKKGNVEFVFRPLGWYEENDGTYFIKWMKKGNGDGTYTRITYNGYGRRTEKEVINEDGDVLKHTTYQNDGETPEAETVYNDTGATTTIFDTKGRVSRIEDTIRHEKCRLIRFKGFGRDGELWEDGVCDRNRAWNRKRYDKERQELEFRRFWNKGKIVSIIGYVDGHEWMVFLDEEGKGKTLEQAERWIDTLRRKSGVEKINLKDENVDAKYKDIAERLIEKWGEYPTNGLN